MLFASKTPRDLNHDPEPFVDDHGCRWIAPVTFQPRTFRYDPRPEFDHVQYNEPNPILVNLRQRIATGFDDVEEFAWWLKNEYNHDTDSWVWEDDSITESHVAHARRVLSRLATPTEGGA